MLCCRCCDVCAKTEGEPCGGPGDFSGTCEPSLQCVSKFPVTDPGVCTGKIPRRCCYLPTKTLPFFPRHLRPARLPRFVLSPINSFTAKSFALFVLELPGSIKEIQIPDFHRLHHPGSTRSKDRRRGHGDVCPESERVEVAAGCVIANKRCKCFHKSYRCSNDLHHTWDFHNLSVSFTATHTPT